MSNKNTKGFSPIDLMDDAEMREVFGSAELVNNTGNDEQLPNNNTTRNTLNSEASLDL